MNHTPGPWEFDSIDRVVVKGGSEIAYMGRSANGADVRLIAAAPELLDALILAKDMFIANDLSLPYTFEVIDAAIAKARGQE
jgi:hypothetical protein